MKTYTFPYAGREWDSIIKIKLTDEEAERLEASAHVAPRWHLDEDPEIHDIAEKVDKEIREANMTMMVEDGRMAEAHNTWLYFHPEATEEDLPSDDEFLVEEMGNWHSCYPEELQDSEKEEDE